MEFENKFWPKVRVALQTLETILEYLEKDGGNFDDLGNEIGIILGEFLIKNDNFDLNDFIDGLNHGVSCSDLKIVDLATCK